MKGLVEGLGEKAQKDVIRLSVEGLSHAAISDRLNEEYGVDLNSQNISTFLNRNKGKSFSILREGRNFDQKLAKTYFDTLNQINNLNNELWQFFYEIKKQPELKDKIIKCTHCGKRVVLQMQSYNLLLKTAEQILKQIEHVDKVMGRIKDKSLTVNYNIVDMSRKLVQVLPQLMHDAERQGLIKITSRKKLKEI